MSARADPSAIFLATTLTSCYWAIDSGARAPRLILEAMADSCSPGPDKFGRFVACRTCGTSGKPVESPTVKALLTAEALARYEDAAYRFCPDATCAVVYFAETGTTFTTDDVRARVWQKEPPGHRTFCCCFGENEADIAREIEQTGRSGAVQRVRAHIAAQRCACEIRNPRGACCLGDLQAAVERLPSSESIAPMNGRPLRIGELPRPAV